MTSSPITDEIHRQTSSLPLTQQRQVLDFVRSLASSKPRGVPGSTLLDLAGSITLDDLTRMQQAIAEGCEEASSDGW